MDGCKIDLQNPGPGSKIHLDGLAILGQILLPHLHIGKDLLIGKLRAQGPAQHGLRRRVELEQPAPAVKGHHAVRHVAEEGIQLIALLAHLSEGALQLDAHLVEGLA